MSTPTPTPARSTAADHCCRLRFHLPGDDDPTRLDRPMRTTQATAHVGSRTIDLSAALRSQRVGTPTALQPGAQAGSRDAHPGAPQAQRAPASTAPLAAAHSDRHDADRPMPSRPGGLAPYCAPVTPIGASVTTRASPHRLGMAAAGRSSAAVFRPHERRTTPRLAVLLLVMALLGLAGCGKDTFEDRTARVTVDGRGTGYTIDSCGLDGRTLFMVGRADDGSVLQAVVGLAEDRKKGVTASTGFSVTQGPTTLEAFGKESWQRRGKSGPPPGEVTSARLRGARIQLAGQARFVDENEVPTASETIDVSIEARCDEQKDRPGG